jgi:SHS2 domain-containing protein
MAHRFFAKRKIIPQPAHEIFEAKRKNFIAFRQGTSPIITLSVENYEILEHTADIGIRVKATDLAGLFKNAGLAICAISAEKQAIIDQEKYKIIVRQKASNVEELFVNWLNELLSLSAVEALIFEDIQINQVGDNFIEAVAIGSDIKNYKVNTEIKAATYHQLKVEKTTFGWQAEVIFDV